MATSVISNQIRNGEIEVGLAMGYEHMTAKWVPFPFSIPFRLFETCLLRSSPSSHSADKGSAPLSEEMMAHPVAKDCIQPMGWTSENVAADFQISRERMDEVAAMSHQRAEKAQQDGIFSSEIVPINAVAKDQNGNKQRVVISQDDGIRKGTTKEALGRIRSAFPQWKPSNTTGGNASQITDGGAFVLLMTRRKAEELGVPWVDLLAGNYPLGFG